MKVYVLFLTNLWHQSESQELISIASSQEKAIELAQSHSKGKLSNWDLQFMRDHNQSQCDSDSDRDYEYVIEEFELNK